MVERALRRHLHVTGVCEVASDMLGAARALCGDQPGIACILGTGSNSCAYDGEKIVKNVPALGFILGDEGSGAVLGKTLVADILKNQLPQPIIQRFNDKYHLTAAARSIRSMEGIFRSWMARLSSSRICAAVASFMVHASRVVFPHYKRYTVPMQFDFSFKPRKTLI